MLNSWRTLFKIAAAGKENQNNSETSGVKNFQQTGMKLRFFLFLLKDTWPGQLFL
jgi:hypothetical protein